MDSPDINASHSGSRLLSMDSPTFPSDSSHSRTGHGGADLSLSELSLSDNSIMNKPFSLLARYNPPEPPADVATPTKGDKGEVAEDHPADQVEDADDVHTEAEEPQDPEVARKNAQELREQKLQSDMFILKKLNASFELFHEALSETGSANERVAAQITETDALLDKYINILSKSEEFSRLIFDERWHGAEADEEVLIREIQEAQERARREAEERERKEREEQERQEEQRKREEKQRLEREKSERAIRGGIRGVRGTRASTRGSVSTRTAASSGTSRGVPKRPPATTARPSGSGIPRASYRPT